METRIRAQQRIRVLVADGTRIHTDLLAGSLRCNPLLEIFTPASNPDGPVETAVHHKINVAVLGCRLAEQPLGGLEALRRIRARRPEARGVILLDSAKPETVLESFRAGARGLFSRDAALDTLSECIRRVHEGEVFANSEQLAIALEALASSATPLAARLSSLSLLSKRELDVVLSLAEGLSNREIAARLGLSQHTIKNYLFRVFDKLGVSSRTELLFLTMNHSVASKHADENNSENRPSFASSHKAAEQGMPSAQLAVASMFADGKGVSKDILSAYMWYLISEKNVLDLKDSINTEKRRIAALLTTEDILEAQKRALEHQKKPVQPAPLDDSQRALSTGSV